MHRDFAKHWASPSLQQGICDSEPLTSPWQTEAPSKRIQIKNRMFFKLLQWITYHGMPFCSRPTNGLLGESQWSATEKVFTLQRSWDVAPYISKFWKATADLLLGILTYILDFSKAQLPFQLESKYTSCNRWMTETCHWWLQLWKPRILYREWFSVLPLGFCYDHCCKYKIRTIFLCKLLQAVYSFHK